MPSFFCFFLCFSKVSVVLKISSSCSRGAKAMCLSLCNMGFLSQVSSPSSWHPDTVWETLNLLSSVQPKTVYRIDLSSSNLCIWRQVTCRSTGLSRAEFSLSDPFLRSWLHHVMQWRGITVFLTSSMHREVPHREAETSNHPWLLDRHMRVPTHLCLQEILPRQMNSFSWMRCQSKA